MCSVSTNPDLSSGNKNEEASNDILCSLNEMAIDNTKDDGDDKIKDDDDETKTITIERDVPSSFDCSLFNSTTNYKNLTSTVHLQHFCKWFEMLVWKIVDVLSNLILMMCIKNCSATNELVASELYSQYGDMTNMISQYYEMHEMSKGVDYSCSSVSHEESSTEETSAENDENLNSEEKIFLTRIVNSKLKLFRKKANIDLRCTEKWVTRRIQILSSIADYMIFSKKKVFADLEHLEDKYRTDIQLLTGEGECEIKTHVDSMKKTACEWNKYLLQYSKWITKAVVKNSTKEANSSEPCLEHFHSLWA